MQTKPNDTTNNLPISQNHSIPIDLINTPFPPKNQEPPTKRKRILTRISISALVAVYVLCSIYANPIINESFKLSTADIVTYDMVDTSDFLFRYRIQATTATNTRTQEFTLSTGLGGSTEKVDTFFANNQNYISSENLKQYTLCYFVKNDEYCSYYDKYYTHTSDKNTPSYFYDENMNKYENVPSKLMDILQNDTSPLHKIVEEEEKNHSPWKVTYIVIRATQLYNNAWAINLLLGNNNPASQSGWSKAGFFSIKNKNIISNRIGDTQYVRKIFPSPTEGTLTPLPVLTSQEVDDWNKKQCGN